MSTASDTKSVAIEVCVRVRPALPREIDAAGAFHSCVGFGGGSKGKDDDIDTIYVTTTDAPVLIRADGVVDPVAAKRAGLRSFPGTFRSVFDSRASTTAIYDTRIQRATTAVLSGHNATIFAYGQTGSGKTHTIMGDAAGPGLFTLVARDLLAAAAADTSPAGALEVELSSLQIYNETLSDLLCWSSSSLPLGGGAGPDLKVRTAPDGGVDVPGLSRRRVESEEAAGLLLARAVANRRVASTKLNVVSSRSHCVTTFVVTKPGHGRDGSSDAVMWRARLHLVDLAGSERVKDSGVSGQDLKDAAGINLSLFNLVRVVKALGEQAGRGKRQKDAGNSVPTRGRRQSTPMVPYNSSVLTSVLRDALGGDSATTVIATVSPAQLHARETLSTLAFAASCTKVKNTVLRPVHRNRPWAAAAAPATKELGKATKPRLPWAGVKPGDVQCPGGRIVVETSHGSLSALAYGDSAHPLCLCLHGHPSDAESFVDWGLLPALVHAGFYAVALDLPGRGNSPGKPLKTRSEFNLNRGGACAVVLEVIKALGGGAKATIFGYDWGAGIALSFAHAKPYRRHVDRVVAFHPSYNEVSKGELAGCCCPCMLIWCKQDQFHSWAKWKPLAQSLRTALGKRYSEYIFSATDWAKHGWDKQASAIEAKAVAFLTGVDHSNPPAAAHARAAVAGTTTDGRAVIRENNVIVLSRDTGGDAFDPSIFMAPDATRDAVSRLRAACAVRTGPGSLRNMLATHCGGSSGGDCSGSAQKPEVAKLFGHLPELSPATLCDPQRLVELGLWAREPSGWASMSRSARYFPGRRVLARLRVSPWPDGPGYLALSSSEVLPEMYTTHRTVIASDQSAAKAADDIVLDVATHGAGDQSPAVAQVVITRSALAKLNQPHIMPTPTAPHEVQLEDGIRCNYRAPLTKAVMASVAVAVAPFAEQLDFDAPAEECEQVQLAAVRAVRSALDITTFQRNEQNELNGGVGVHSRHRDRARYCGDDAARFAVHGQGHCHTVSSVMTAFLSPLCAALGIDLRYRGGQSHIAEAPAPVANSPESHQWLEFTLRPSGRTYTCDLYATDGASNDDDGEKMLAMPIEIAYASHLYPNGALNRFSGHPVTTAAYTAGDFDV